MDAVDKAQHLQPTQVVKDLWKDYLFSKDGCEPEVGQRLGIQYMQAMQPGIVLKYLDGQEFHFHQESMGLMAISGVLWDAALLLVDYFVHDKRINGDNFCLGYVLDLGCGTGVAGISALLLGADGVIFSDVADLECSRENLAQLSPDLQDKVMDYISYAWNETALPDAFTRIPVACHKTVAANDCIARELSTASKISSASEESVVGSKVAGADLRIWDTLLCSDLLYEETYHSVLLSVLRRIRFRRAVFSYKKRHEEAEEKFFDSLSSWCNLSVVDPASIQLHNLPAKSNIHLFIVIAEPIADPAAVEVEPVSISTPSIQINTSSILPS